MNNCLVTKLKGTVDNPDLPKLGEFKIKVKVKNDVTCPFIIYSVDAMNIKITGQGHFYKGTYDSQTDVCTELNDITYTVNYRVSAGESVISIIPKYKIKSIMFGNTDQFDYLDINFDELSNNLIGLSEVYIGDPDVPRCDFIADVDKIKFEDITLFRVSTVNLRGHIESMAPYVAPPASPESSMEIGPNFAGNPLKTLGGSIEAFIRALTPTAFGKGYIVIRPAGCTLHGEMINIAYRIVSDAQGNAEIKTNGTVELVATYNRATNTFTYVE